MKYKFSFVSVGLLLLFAAGANAQVGRVGRIRSAKYTKMSEIRVFDFLNATYQAECEDEKVKVRDGHYEPPKDTAGAYFEFDVSVSYGDLNGDGVEEALLVTQCSGAVQNYDEGKIFAVVNHRLVKLAALAVVTKNGGSIISADIKNGKIIVVRGPGPNLCKNFAEAAEETAVFRLRGGKLQKVGKSTCKLI